MMERIEEIIRTYDPVTGGTLRVDGAELVCRAAVDPRQLRIEVAAGCAAQVVVLHTGAGVAAIEADLEPDARLELVELFAGRALSDLHIRQGERSRSHLTVVELAEATASCTVDLQGAGASSVVGGVFAVGGDEHCTLTLRTNHRVPECRSDAQLRGIAGGRAVGEFRGLVYVAPGARATDAVQTSRNILLTDAARIVTRPQLEIYADDVKCSHGAAVGQMDAEAIFYMRQRGLSEALARRLQIEGFMGDVVRRCPIEGLGEALAEAVARKLEQL